MTQELAKNLICISMRNGIQIWVDEEKVDALQAQMEKAKFIKISNQIINTADIVGIFNAETMQETTRHKNGQWKCNQGQWHEKFEKCECDVEIPSYATGK